MKRPTITDWKGVKKITDIPANVQHGEIGMVNLTKWLAIAPSVYLQNRVDD